MGRACCDAERQKIQQIPDPYVAEIQAEQEAADAARHWPDGPPLRIADRYAAGRPAGEGGARGVVTARGAIVTDTSKPNERGLHYYLLPKDEDPADAPNILREAGGLEPWPDAENRPCSVGQSPAATCLIRTKRLSCRCVGGKFE